MSVFPMNNKNTKLTRHLWRGLFFLNKVASTETKALLKRDNDAGNFLL